VLCWSAAVARGGGGGGGGGGRLLGFGDDERTYACVPYILEDMVPPPPPTPRLFLSSLSFPSSPSSHPSPFLPSTPHPPFPCLIPTLETNRAGILILAGRRLHAWQDKAQIETWGEERGRTAG
jgi:hypothetical protein